LFVVFGLFIYGSYFNPDFEQTMKDMTAFLEKTESIGNGFGGETGMNVIDSGYRSKRYFWIDDETLAFQTSYSAYAPKDIQRNYIWNTREDVIKPLVCDCSPIDFYDNYFYYAKFSEKKLRPDGNKKADRFRSTLVELEDRWVLENRLNMEDVLDLPSEQFELSWKVDGKPWFRIKLDSRSDSDSPRHRFLYLWEWGWILRMPSVGPEHWSQTTPQMGFFDIDEEVYFGQSGKKVADLIDLKISNLPSVKVVHVGFLDVYWIANQLGGGTGKEKIQGFIHRDGTIQYGSWLNGWPEYSGIPLPTMKGFFWSGTDYRAVSPSLSDSGAYLKTKDGQVHKIVQGEAITGHMSNDGCVVAFFNVPRHDHDNGSLKVVNVCKSTVDGKEFQNVDY
jgi:hypothetical protein